MLWVCSEWQGAGSGHKDEWSKMQKGPWKKKNLFQSAATWDWVTVHLSAPQLPEANSQDNAEAALRQSWLFLSGSPKGQAPKGCGVTWSSHMFSTQCDQATEEKEKWYELLTKVF